MYKKLTTLFLLLAVLLSLSACSAVAQCEPQVATMLNAISGADAEAAFALMHPESGMDQETLETGFSYLVDVFDGRRWESFRINSVNVNSKISSGKERTEEGQYIVTLEDDTELILEYVYISNEEGEGFQRFSLAGK